jgi:glycosyltransferase involved in cell wall biosynthesis
VILRRLLSGRTECSPEDMAMNNDGTDDYRSELDFIKEFELVRGRPLRVLHIGNIANNAYNNALIQRRFGIEADTICYNYYHVMGCPEWEAASFDGRIDSTFPDWWATELGGWQRPDWFVQGPVGESLSYLRAKNAGDKEAASYFWTLLQAKYWEILDGVALADGRVRPPMPRPFARAISVARHYSNIKAQKLLKSVQPLNGSASDLQRSVKSDGPSPVALVYRSFLAKNVFVHLRHEADTGTSTGFEFDLAVWRFQRRLRGLPRFGFEFSSDFFGTPADGIGHLKPTLNGVADHDSSAHPICGSDLVREPEFRFLEQCSEGNDNRALHRATLLDRVLRQFRQFPAEVLRSVDDFASTVANQFADVLEYYDVIQGYSTDGFIPFINGFKNYACYEHGTLREIPFEKTYNGIACRSSYKNAAFSFVTNSDVLPSVKRLKLEKARTVFLPHAYDDRKASDFVAGFKAPKLKSEDATFFSPTRHHWHTAPVSMQKGNDLFLNAAARMARTNRNFRIILVEWGVDVQRSKDLIRSLGIEDMVVWRPTLNKAELREAYLSCDVVVDQFVIPAMGGVAFEAMALGRRVITRLDEDQTAEFFGAAPPCLTADSVESCAARISEVLDDPSDTAGRGNAARLWFKKHHSARRVVALQLAAYRKIVRFDSASGTLCSGNQAGPNDGFAGFGATPSFPSF